MATQSCPIVGIGASAGSLDALKSLFAAMPADTGAAFVVVQHLDPRHESLIADILGRSTAMPVVQVEDGMAVEPNHVYVIPPNAYLTLKESTFHIGAAVLRHGVRMPIDTFLWSLAEERAERAVAVIVSGSGTDGALGVRAVKGNGGLVMAQSPETAQYDGMPLSAIATGMVDHVGPVESMPEILNQFLHHPFLLAPERSPESPAQPDEERSLRRILALLRARKGYDFRAYKQGTMLRRVARRMGLHRIDNLDGYLEFLRDNADEASDLVQDLLIGVTAFFRDGEAFEALDQHVIAPIVALKGADEPIRVWVPGCGSGEEAYSIAMLLMERLEAAGKPCPVQIFATDIDEPALNIARNGIYPENIAAAVPAERLRRYFRKEDNVYHVSKALRETVTFAEQNLISDPPFSRLDLVSCRNLLIYLEAEVQRKVLALFHFALQEGGYLFLGHSETVGQQDELFEPLVKKWRIYRRTGTVQRTPVEFPGGAARPRPAAAIPRAASRASEQMRLADTAEQLLLADFAPAAVLVDDRHQALYFYGPTSRYLDQPTGAPTQDLLYLVRPELRTRLRALLRQSASRMESAVVENAHISRGDVLVPVRMTVRPVSVPAVTERAFLVTFEDIPEAAPPAERSEPLSTSESSLVAQLEYELKVTREELQTTIEEQESANEELQAANEEVMSVNEELQSTNEELETSKEELQSMNEELTTVNNQLKDKVDELGAANDDLANLLNNTDIATLFLDTELCIRRFTPQTRKLLNLIATDVGRPLADISQRFSDGDLVGDAARVLETLAPAESEVHTEDDSYYLRRTIPYRTGENRIDGVVITFVDISRRRRAEERVQILAAAVRDSNDAVTVQDFDGNIIAWNRGAERIYGWSEDEALAMNIREIVPEAGREAALAYVTRLAAGEELAQFTAQRVTKAGRVLDMLVTATLLRDAPIGRRLFATTERDVTVTLKADAVLRQSEARATAYLESAPDAILLHNLDGEIVHTNARAESLFGYTKDEMVGRPVEMLMPARYRDRHVGHRRAYLEDMQARTMGLGLPLTGRTKDGTEFPIEVTLSPVEDFDGPIIAAGIRDMSERARIEDALRKATREAEQANAAKSRFLATASHDLRQPLQSLVLLNGALRRTIEDPEAQRIVERQAASLNGMRNLLNSLLDITQLESGAMTPEIVDAPLQEVFDQVAATFDEEAKEKGLTLRIDQTEAIVHTDANLVTQAIDNLVANAIRYTESGEVRLRAEQDGDRVTIAVTDTGIGIPADQLERIFDEFHKVAPAERQAGQGSGLGLGLAIAKRIADLLDTVIDVESEVGRGSTFRFALPAGKPTDAGPDEQTAGRQGAGEGLVLLLDDDEEVVGATKTILETEGYRVVTATSPETARNLMRTLPRRGPDIVVTDYRLDGATGIDIIRAVRQRARRRVPAILITGDTSPTVGALGGEDVEILIKPIDTDELFSAMRRLLDRATH